MYHCDRGLFCRNLLRWVFEEQMYPPLGPKEIYQVPK